VGSPREQPGKRGPFARAFCFGAALLGACAPGVREQAAVRPSLQQQATYQVVGDAVVASLGGATVTVRWLHEKAVDQYYAARQGLVHPWPRKVWQEAPPTVFALAVRNHTREEVQFDPVLAALVTQQGRRERAIPYEDLYMRLVEEEGTSPRLASLQATLFSRFVVIPPGGQREGLLVFPTLEPEAKHLVLDLASFFIGGRIVPGLFEFQVIRQKTE
jgi:hypothetical protein